MSNSNDGTVWESIARASSRLLASTVQANTAAFGAFAGSSIAPRDGEQDAADDDESGAADDEAAVNDRDAPPEERIEPGIDLPSWEVTTPPASVTTLAVGDEVTFAKTVSEDDVRGFAVASGDTNPVHLDDEYAAATRFGGRIAHGGLVSGLISAALARLPGAVVYLSQSVEYQAPVDVGERATAVVEVVESLGDGRYRLRTTVETADATAASGEAVVLLEAPPDS